MMRQHPVLNINLFGQFGSGKGTQRKMLMEKFDLGCIETGSIIRGEIAQETELGKKFEELLKLGMLVPDEDIFAILRTLLKNYPATKGIVFDGLPRTLVQKEFFDAEVAKVGREPLNIEIVISDATSLQRQTSRIEDRFEREESIATNRIKMYHEKIVPVIAAYKQSGNMYAIDGERSVEEVFQDILKIVEEHGHYY